MNKRPSFDDWDEQTNPRPETNDFDRVVDRALSRRGFLGSTLAFGSGAAVMGTGLFAAKASAATMTAGFPFTPIAASTADDVIVPEGYKWDVLVKWGDPLWSDAPEFDEATRGTGASQERAFGDNTDGMALFERDGKTVFAINNEYTNLNVICGNNATGLPESEDDVRKVKAAHGLSVVEVALVDGKWSVIKDSAFNRRVLTDTPFEMTGPARGHDLIKTAVDVDGVAPHGTFNNCGNGRTPWGTYLTCEENFNGLFRSSNPDVAITPEYERYGIGVEDWGYAWGQYDDRFDISATPNEPNRHGYIVELDPFDANSTPKKHSALGRFKHENAECIVADNGHIVVYMGDDERGEFLYKYVSAAPYVAGEDTDHLLTEGQLYVAKFHDDATGEWIALTPETTGMDAGHIAIFTRMAASAAGGTTMDRPEWVSTNPMRAEAYCCLTNNKNRGVKTNAGGDETPVGGPNPREANNYGQIVRWRPVGEDHAAATFTWDLYVMAGNPTNQEGLYAGSGNEGNLFNSPDGMSFDTNGLVWIQTDGNYSNAGEFSGMGNNQMLVGNPETGRIERFMVGPNEAEVTGATWSPDGKFLFVGIQHPGEELGSHWPNGGESVPRSAIIQITRTDGAAFGGAANARFES